MHIIYIEFGISKSTQYKKVYDLAEQPHIVQTAQKKAFLK